MAWNTQRNLHLPPDWQKRRAEVRKRANGVCQHPGCTDPGTDCDHIERGNNHDLSNLQWLCAAHHHEKTLRESKEARIKNGRLRAPMRHPGLT